MKKRLFKVLWVIILCAALPLNVLALGNGYILDQAGLLTQEEADSLEKMAQAVSEEYQLDVVILTVDSIGTEAPGSFAEDFYDRSGFLSDGFIFLLAMESRDWYISAVGKTTGLLSEWEMDDLGYEAVEYLSDGAYYDAFCTLLALLPAALDTSSSYQNPGSSTSYPAYTVSNSSRWGGMVLISLGIGLVVALVAVLIMRGTMNTKRRQRSAVEYMVSGSYSLPLRQDIFLYSQVTKTKKAESNSSGGAHRSAGGNVHSGRGGKF